MAAHLAVLKRVSLRVCEKRHKVQGTKYKARRHKAQGKKAQGTRQEGTRCKARRLKAKKGIKAMRHKSARKQGVKDKEQRRQ